MENLFLKEYLTFCKDNSCQFYDILKNSLDNGGIEISRCLDSCPYTSFDVLYALIRKGFIMECWRPVLNLDIPLTKIRAPFLIKLIEKEII